jgi:hypothetical protein
MEVLQEVRMQMHKPVHLTLPEDWKQRTRVFVTPRKPVETMTPLVAKAAYDSDRESNARAGAVRPSATTKRKLVLQH